MAVFTKAGHQFLESMTQWLQNTRLMSEAVHRLRYTFRKDGKIQCSHESWPKPPKKEQATLPLGEFTMEPLPLAQRMESLPNELWKSQFVFLESLWEEYLQQMVLELKEKDAAIFEPFCEKEFMSDIVRKVLVEDLESTEEIKTEVASRFAAGITRCPWREQWRHLKRLNIGISDADFDLPWFKELDLYFEMRNCLVHRQGKVSTLLNSKTTYFRDAGRDTIVIWPAHLDHYRKQFLACLNHIEGKTEAKYGKKKRGPTSTST